MSERITLRLLKKSNIHISPSFVELAVNRYLEEHKDDVFDCCKPSNPQIHPKFVESTDNSFDYIMVENKTPYNVALEYNFNSIASSVKDVFVEEFGMYSCNPQRKWMVIDECVAREMLVAVDYILLEHYDKKIEDVLQNRFIESIGSMSGAYQKYDYNLRFPDDKEYSEEDHSDTIKRFRTILSAFLETCSEGGYILTATVWG